MAKLKPDDFLLNTDYEMDKIVLFKQGDFTGSTTIQHNLKFTPLIFGVWSTDENFEKVNSIGVRENDPEIPGLYTPILSVTGTALNNNTITLTSHGENSGTTKIYYRVYAFEPCDSKQSAPQTAKLAGSLIFNTDYNYRKLLKEGEFTQETAEFEHNLGYIPQVMAWTKYSADYDNPISPIMSKSEFTNFGITVTDKKIKFNAGGTITAGIVEKVYWSVYYDKA